MTYCVGMLLRDGLLMASDSLTNAGVDNIATYRKMTVWEDPGERLIVMVTAGNLSVTQSVVTLLEEGVPEGDGGEAQTMAGVPSMTAAARLVGAAAREVERIDGPSLAANGVKFDFSALLGGQLAGRELRLFRIYREGNFIEARPETPFLQIGETKYGKPILDRVVNFKISLTEAAKCAMISMDSTMRSNLSVGLPMDLVACERGEQRLRWRRLIDETDPYFAHVHGAWSDGLRQLFRDLPEPDWDN